MCKPTPELDALNKGNYLGVNVVSKATLELDTPSKGDCLGVDLVCKPTPESVLQDYKQIILSAGEKTKLGKSADL